jgi:hypothetical protein
MIVDGTSVSIAAGATTNVFLGRPSEYPAGAQPTVMRLLANADAAGLQCQLLQNVGANQIAPIAGGATLNVAAAAGQGPKDDEDTLISNVPVPQGTRQAFNITNTTGGAVIMRWRAMLL